MSLNHRYSRNGKKTHRYEDMLFSCILSNIIQILHYCISEYLKKRNVYVYYKSSKKRQLPSFSIVDDVISVYILNNRLLDPSLLVVG